MTVHLYAFITAHAHGFRILRLSVMAVTYKYSIKQMLLASMAYVVRYQDLFKKHKLKNKQTQFARAEKILSSHLFLYGLILRTLC